MSKQKINFMLVISYIKYMLTNSIIHSKYFPDSDWLKAHG